MAGRLIGGSISFDHAADVYDATRTLPEDVARKLTDALVVEIERAGADRLLEIGIGTGRIARPLAERGVRVLGVDIAPRMLARLREQLGQQHVAPDLVLGDATRLPFRSGSFRAVLGVHILHLVSSLEQAVAELRRVLAPEGSFLHHRTRYLGDNPWDPIWAKWDELANRRKFARRKRPWADEIQGALEAAGGSCQARVYATGEERTTPAFWLENIRKRTGSQWWQYPDDLFQAIFAEFEPWYREHYGDLEREYVQQVSYELEVWGFG